MDRGEAGFLEGLKATVLIPLEGPLSVEILQDSEERGDLRQSPALFCCALQLQRCRDA